MQAFDIGQRFVRYYRDGGFQVLPGSSLLDPVVPMTFVMSAGLAHIESTTDQSEEHAGERYVLLQTCFRHFDLDKIGHSPVHLSLFTMPGAFCFGKASKKDTIGKVWRFLVDELGFDRRRLVVTCFAGGELEGHRLGRESEAVQAWQDIGPSRSQIVDVGIDAGFWKQGGGLYGKERFRKCGPTTEVFFDRGPQRSCGADCRPGCRCGRFIEIANVLFIRSHIDDSTGVLSPLATPFDETVIGAERVAMALGRASSVFELPCIAPLVAKVHAYQKPGSPVAPYSVRSDWAIADHVRALLFLVADGAPPPGQGGRSGIVKKLIRETLTHQKRLGITESGFIPDLVVAAIGLYGRQRTDLVAARERLLGHFAAESERFERTLSAGYRRLDRFLKRRDNGTLSGEQAIDLVKHYGVPLLLLEIELARRDMPLDRQAYERAYRRWRQVEVGAT